MADIPDKIADLCLKHFTKLSKIGKPSATEWTVLSCIVMEYKNQLNIIASGTGSKCIGRNKMSRRGDMINDSHAEVMCRRSFLRFLYEEMMNGDSLLHFNDETKKYFIHDDIKFHFFTTHMPCGDAAIFPKQNFEEFGDLISEDNFEHIPTKKPKIDIYRTGAKCLDNSERQDLKFMGENCHVPGVVRYKPGRGDPTLSVSCSDKLAKWCHVGIQGALISLLLEKPLYLSTFTIAKNTPFSVDSLYRALYGRFGDVHMQPPYFQSKMVITQSTLKFEFYKDDKKQPCPSSISWCNVHEKPLEVAVQGKKQGVTKKDNNKNTAQLKICKYELFKSFVNVCKIKGIYFENINLAEVNYKDMKMYSVEYQRMWKDIKKLFKTWTHKNEDFLNFQIR